MMMEDRDLLERALRAYLRALTVFDPVRLRFWVARGLTMPQLRIMFILSRQMGVTPGALAEKMRVSPSTVTGLTDRLMRQRLIVREEDAEDRRLVRLRLSDEGRRAIGELETAGRAHFEEIAASMPSDHVEKLAELLEEFVTAAAAIEERETAIEEEER